MEDKDFCNTGLVLGIGCGRVAVPSSDRRRKQPVDFHLLFPPHPQKFGDQEHELCMSNSKSPDDEEEDGKQNCNETEENAPRKKLRLTKEQSSLLEESFIEHSTLTLCQKQDLAAKLNLRPRQVEVWFQNRRARTKLKQTEIDCEFLKKCCENLSAENRRLKKELLELRSMKMGSPLYIQLPRGPTVMAMCPSCEKVVRPKEGNSSFDVSKTKFYEAIKDSSMAC